jgi:hypothetical protein
MDESVKISLLKDEYLLIQKQYEDFDTRIMTIKGWSATVGLVALGTGFQYSRFLWLFAALASLLFWILEAIWKSFQYNYSNRIQRIERAFATEEFHSIQPLQIFHAWLESFRSGSQLRTVIGILKLPLVFFPHVVPVVVGPALFVWNHFQPFVSK